MSVHCFGLYDSCSCDSLTTMFSGFWWNQTINMIKYVIRDSDNSCYKCLIVFFAVGYVKIFTLNALRDQGIWIFDQYVWSRLWFNFCQKLEKMVIMWITYRYQEQVSAGLRREHHLEQSLTQLQLDTDQHKERWQGRQLDRQQQIVDQLTVARDEVGFI